MAQHDAPTSERTARPAAAEYAPFYAGYVARVPAGDIIDVLRRQGGETTAFFRSIPDDRTTTGYAAGKWSIRDIVQHMSDTERIMSYRALRIARGDRTPLPGFEEKDYTPMANANTREMALLLAELEIVRRSTIALLEGLPGEAWPRNGTANGTGITVRALATIIAGHELHHLAIVRERYLAR